MAPISAAILPPSLSHEVMFTILNGIRTDNVLLFRHHVQSLVLVSDVMNGCCQPVLRAEQVIVASLVECATRRDAETS